MEQTWYLYILRCKDGTLYTGITTDVEKRFQTHQSGKGAKYTRGRTPLELVYREKCGTHSDALRREWEVKQLSREEKELLIAGAGKRRMKRMVFAIRDAVPADFEYILGLNEKDVVVLSPMDEAKAEYFRETAELFQVVEADGQPAGFLIVMREGADYTSENYIWFSEQYGKFLYIDRIVIDENYRRTGLGRYLYDSVCAYAAETDVPVVTAEVDIRPVYNEPSFGFHKEMGFREVGQQIIRGGDVEVSLQAKEIGTV
jgi:predicted GNAT superfamily acetyltransferase